MNPIDLNWLRETNDLVRLHRVKSRNRDWKIETKDLLRVLELSIQAAEEYDNLRSAMYQIEHVTSNFRGGHKSSIDAIMEVHKIAKDSLR